MIRDEGSRLRQYPPTSCCANGTDGYDRPERWTGRINPSSNKVKLRYTFIAHQGGPYHEPGPFRPPSFESSNPRAPGHPVPCRDSTSRQYHTPAAIRLRRLSVESRDLVPRSARSLNHPAGCQSNSLSYGELRGAGRVGGSVAASHCSLREELPHHCRVRDACHDPYRAAATGAHLDVDPEYPPEALRPRHHRRAARRE